MWDCIKIIQGLSADVKIENRFCKTCTVACCFEYSLKTQFLVLEYSLNFMSKIKTSTDYVVNDEPRSRMCFFLRNSHTSNSLSVSCKISEGTFSKTKTDNKTMHTQNTSQSIK